VEVYDALLNLLLDYMTINLNIPNSLVEGGVMNKINNRDIVTINCRRSINGAEPKHYIQPAPENDLETMFCFLDFKNTKERRKS